MMVIGYVSRAGGWRTGTFALVDLSWGIKHVWSALGRSPKDAAGRECKSFPATAECQNAISWLVHRATPRATRRHEPLETDEEQTMKKLTSSALAVDRIVGSAAPARWRRTPRPARPPSTNAWPATRSAKAPRTRSALSCNGLDGRKSGTVARADSSSGGQQEFRHHLEQGLSSSTTSRIRKAKIPAPR